MSFAAGCRAFDFHGKSHTMDTLPLPVTGYLEKGLRRTTRLLPSWLEGSVEIKMHHDSTLMNWGRVRMRLQTASTSHDAGNFDVAHKTPTPSSER
jgi:hypothetical protein